MKKLLILLLLIPSLSSSNTLPTFFSNFSGICINGLNILESVYELASIKDWKTLPEEAKDLVRPADGGDVDAWIYKDNDTTIIIGIAERTIDGSKYSICSMAGKGGFNINVEALLSNYDLEFYDRQKQGIQVSDMYIYSHPSFKDTYITTLGSTTQSIKTFSFSAIGIN